MTIFKKLLGVKTSSLDAQKIVKLIYFGLLHRLPEATTLQMLTDKICLGMKPAELLESVMRSAEFRQKISLDRVEDYLSLLPKDIQKSREAEAFEFVKSGKDKKIKNIIYLSPAISWPVGGIKVLLRHSELINTPLLEGVHSEVYFPEVPEFTLDWFEHKAKIKRDTTVNINEDLIILPEVWVIKYGALLLKHNVKYVIFVQNGYSIFDEILQGNKSDVSLLTDIYKNSALILSVSHDTAQCIIDAFDILPKKIHIIVPSINQKLFTYKRENKKNIITYMPRKLTSHSSYIINRLLNKKESWEIIPIEGINESEVAQLMSISKLFLSFSDREGLALPPLEAALCGNIVIGYTGEGAKEYWSGPIFKGVASGNLLEFLKLIDIEMTKIKHNTSVEDDFEEKAKCIEKLRGIYSPEKERQCLKNFIRLIA